MPALRFWALLAPLALLAVSVAQNNPVPFINQPLIPSSAAPGSAGFTLTVNGTGFVRGSVVDWNGNPRTTTFVSASQLTAQILASDVSVAGTGSVAVVSPPSGGGISTPIFLPVSSSTLTVSTYETDITVGPFGASLALADFNHDGKLDLAVLSQCAVDGCNVNSGAFVTILLGNGDGTFTNAGTVATPIWATAMAVGDFNGDGNQDLAVASGNTTATLSIYLGNGDGTFRSGSTLSGTGGDSDFIGVGDFNGDGKLDLVVDRACFNATGVCSNGGASILLGNGDGTFTFASSPFGGGISIAVADVNNDGNLDLVYSTGIGVSILIGQGDGTFSPGVTLDQGLISKVAVGDFNGDGNLDIANFVKCTANPCESGYVSILLGNGDGTFTDTSTVNTGPFNWFGVVGEFNADDKIDLVGVSACTELTCANGEATFELGNGDGTFTRASASPAGPDLFTSDISTVVGDFNGDGRLDLATLSQCGDKNCDSFDGVVSILLQDSALTLSASSLSFGTQTVAAVSAVQTVTLTNNSSAAITLTSFVTSGEFSQTHTCSTSLAAYGSCTVSIGFAPKTKGPKTGLLTITTDAGPNTRTVSLSGTGTVVGLSTHKLLFGAQRVGTTSAPLRITLMNEGTAPLNIDHIRLVGFNADDFAENNNCGTVLGSRQTCGINVTFTPSKKGIRSAIIRLFDNGGGSPQEITVGGDGT